MHYRIRLTFIKVVKKTFRGKSDKAKEESLLYFLEIGDLVGSLEESEL
jgi:hypothetical protein